MKTSPHLPRAADGRPRTARSRAADARRAARPWLAALLLSAAAWLALPATRAQDNPDGGPLLELASFPRSTLTIHSATRPDAHVFRIWVADTPPRQQQGLMYVRDLPAEEGMLFVEPRSRVWGMWMKNTYIPLDMLFIDSRGRIAAIFERTVPHSLQTLSWPRPVKGVLELRAGETSRRGIRTGDRVEHPAFGAARQP